MRQAEKAPRGLVFAEERKIDVSRLSPDLAAIARAIISIAPSTEKLVIGLDDEKASEHPDA